MDYFPEDGPPPLQPREPIYLILPDFLSLLVSTLDSPTPCEELHRGKIMSMAQNITIMMNVSLFMLGLKPSMFSNKITL